LKLEGKNKNFEARKILNLLIIIKFIDMIFLLAVVKPPRVSFLHYCWSKVKNKNVFILNISIFVRDKLFSASIFL
jgi:hypothetical protein